MAISNEPNEVPQVEQKNTNDLLDSMGAGKSGTGGVTYYPDQNPDLDKVDAREELERRISVILKSHRPFGSSDVTVQCDNFMKYGLGGIFTTDVKISGVTHLEVNYILESLNMINSVNNASEQGGKYNLAFDIKKLEIDLLNKEEDPKKLLPSTRPEDVSAEVGADVQGAMTS